MLSIEVLGGLRITPRIKPKKGKAILAYLAWAARPVCRATIAGIFWPYQTTDQSLHSLRNALYELRRVIGDAFLGDLSDVSLCGDYYSDLEELRRLLAAGDRQSLEAAVSLYRGPMLDGFEINSEPWRDWVMSEDEKIRLDISQAMTSLVEMQSSAGEHDLAVYTARKLSWMDSYDESSVRLLMRELVACGRKAEAIACFRKVEDHLKSELGCAPDAETTELFSQITGGAKPYPNVARFRRQEPPQRNDDGAARSRMTASHLASRIETIRAELGLALTDHAKLSRQAVRDMVIELDKIAEDLRLLEPARRHAIA